MDDSDLGNGLQNSGTDLEVIDFDIIDLDKFDLEEFDLEDKDLQNNLQYDLNNDGTGPQTAVKGVAAEPAPQKPTAESAPQEAPKKPALQKPAAEPVPQAEDADDGEVVRQLLSSVRELTDEVKRVRVQLETQPYDASVNPSERSPGISAGETGPYNAPPGSVASGPGSDAVQEAKEEPKKNKVFSIISSVLFYAVLVAMVLGAFLLRSTSSGRPFMLAGFSAANVLTSSMNDVYPQGSLIVTKSVDPKELKIGDDITFMVSADSSITHRIIGITENYRGTGERAFETKGTMNKNADKEPVAAANVVGKVIFHSKILGDFTNFVKANWIFLLFVLFVVVGLISFLKWNAGRSDDEEENPPKKPDRKEPEPRSKKKTKNQ